ncbi:MAG TPA: hypothetical protein VF708_05535 [Pyrinomonadaceae bacterium]|jgi:hypothetical protein
MANPSDLISHYSSHAFFTRIAALTSVGAVLGAAINRLDDPIFSLLVGYALIMVVISLAELNRRYTHSYISACRAAGMYLDSDTEEGRSVAKRWRYFIELNEKPYESAPMRFLLSWLTYLPGLILGEVLILKSCGWRCWMWIGFRGVFAILLGVAVLMWWAYVSIEIQARIPRVGNPKDKAAPNNSFNRSAS